MEMQKEFLEMIESDIQRIDSSVVSGSDESRWELFRELDGRYQTCIANFYKGMWQSLPEGNVLYFIPLKKCPDQVIDNLKMVKAKLETFRYQANAINLPPLPTTQVNVNTNVNVNVTFEQVRSQIEDMTSLTDEETNEILDKISKLEEIINSKDKKKTKWEKVKPVVKWLADKSFDVGMTLLPLLLKLQ